MPLLEVISTSPFDSQYIEAAGADRIQLVSALQIGGLTPSSTIVRKCLEAVNIRTMVMVRHHNNGFFHNQSELKLFQEEIINLQQLGVRGIVVGGIVQKDNQIKLDQGLVEMVKNTITTNKVEVTFHKAFDCVTNKAEQLVGLGKLGIDRVLTQGGQQKILQNKEIIKVLIKKSKNSSGKVPRILLGGGINFQNVQEICKQFCPQQIHIGTCVRQNKYGNVSKQKVKQFVKLIK